jgi:hypothetical protein
MPFPHELNVLALENPRLFYDLLFTASAQAFLKKDPSALTQIVVGRSRHHESAEQVSYENASPGNDQVRIPGHHLLQSDNRVPTYRR